LAHLLFTLRLSACRDLSGRMRCPALGENQGLV
jgi:hypothetical protein